jgi:hypothetical protein
MDGLLLHGLRRNAEFIGDLPISSSAEASSRELGFERAHGIKPRLDRRPNGGGDGLFTSGGRPTGPVIR